jgi:hypothetical protein
MTMRILVLALLAMAGAASANTPVGLTLPEDRPTSIAPPLSVWKPIGTGGYEHVQTGLLCPASLGDLDRNEVKVFDSFGLDVGCNYSDDTTSLTYFLSRRASGGAETALAAAERDLLKVHADAHPKALGERREHDGGLDWQVALYSQDRDQRSGIWVADLHGWTLEFRATYAAADEAEVFEAVRQAVTESTAAADRRLAACAKPRGAQGSGGAPKGRIACVDSAAERNGFPMVFWRELRDGPSNERVTAVTRLEPVSLEVSATSDGRWVATHVYDGRTLVYGYYPKRPTTAEMADLFAGILAGTARPVAYGAADAPTGGDGGV